jgi:hypothetical protein
MATQNGPITKIYQLRVEGFEESKVQFDKMSAELAKLKKQKQDLDKELLKSTKPAEVAALNQKIQAQVVLEAELTKSIQEKNRQIQIGQTLNETNGTEGIGAAIIAYQNLIKQYKEALANSQLMEAQFGKESAEAIEAARTAAIYEAELAKINRLRSTPVTPTINTPVADVPFTSNLAELEAEQAALRQTGTVLNEFDLQQQEAANSAVAMGQAQLTAAEEVKAAQPAFVATTGSLDQYTGSLRDNIRVQLENAQAIAANRAAQKAINEEIKASGGSATEQQIERLAALREESVILDQSQKQLTTTIRNQAREFVAANGSLEEGRAKVNQLQQAYAQLSETERAQPFGQGIKQEIDILEPKVKQLEAEIGLFQRNVGNYPSNFTGAFKVLENELDVLHGKLVQGNFTGSEFDQLTKKTAVLNQVTQSLNTTFKTTAQEQTAFKEAARQVGTTFGTESVVFQNFSKEVGAGNAKLKESDIALNAVSSTGSKAGNVFKNLFGVLRQAANILPGIGLSGLILLLITPLEALASKIADVATASFKGGDGMKNFKERLEEMSNAVHESQKGFVDAFTAVETLRINVDLARQGFLKKDDVLKQYNETMGKTTGQLKNFDEIESKLVNSGPAYIQMMLLRAAANVALESAAKKAFEAEEARRKSDLEFSTFFNRFNTAVSSAPGFVPDNGTEERARKAREKSAQEAKAKVIKDAKDAEKLQVSIAEDFSKRAAQIQTDPKYKFSFLPEPDAKKTKEHADRLNIEEQNALKLIDATFKTELSVENTRVTEIEKIHQLSFDEEIRHAKRIEEITVNSLNSKIALLSKVKNKNAEELAQLAEFREKRSEIELSTSKQIQEIEKKRFADQNKDLKTELDANIAQAKEAQQKVLDNPNTSNLDRAKANLEFIDTEIIAYQQYYNQLLELNDNYSKEELQKVREHLSALTKERTRGLGTDLVAEEKDLEQRNRNEIVQINIKYSEIRENILRNDRLTSDERQKQLTRLERAHQRTILTSEVEHLTKETNAMFILFAKGLKSEEDYIKKLEELKKKKGDLQASLDEDPKDEKSKPSNLAGLLGEGINKLFPKLDDAEKGAVDDAINDSFSLATDAMHSYYDAEQQRIQQSLALNLQRLDLERDQLKARSQSQAESESIDRQYEQKKKDAQKRAGEEIKKSKRAELKIALVTELANDAVAAAAYGFPFNLAIFGVLAGLAYGRYALGLGAINAQQFAYGGEVPKRGGKFGGKPHSQGGTKFNYKHEEYEAEVDELAIIRTRNAPARNKIFQIVGTHQQIASQLNVIGGGVSFAPGAKLKRFADGGTLGATLQAPIFTQASNSSTVNNNGISRDQFETLIGKIDTMNSETSKRFERIEVVQVTNTVTKAQQKQVKQSSDWYIVIMDADKIFKIAFLIFTLIIIVILMRWSH